MKGFVTKEHLSYRKAVKQDFQLISPGTKWGAKWEYGWFKGQILIPNNVTGKSIVLNVDTGAESAVFVGGKPAGMAQSGELNTFIREPILLTRNAEPKEVFDIVIESYAGHGPRVKNTGPLPPERKSVPEPGSTQVVMGKTTFGIWEEEFYQLWLDVETLFQLRENLDPKSLRVIKIDEGLKEFTEILDLEANYEKRMKSANKARKKLKPLLECKNGSTVPTMYTFGHSHLDIAWLWPIAETKHKVLRTFSSQLSLMKLYPEYCFLQSQPYLYKIVEEKYPQLYKSIKKAVKRKQFIPEGAMWVEADTNLSGGESLIRQFLYGKKFFKGEFDLNSRLCWLPDVFGYSGALPQIMKKCGVDYFATQKILWTYKGLEKFPYSHFQWEGIDGTKILAHIFNDYNAQTRPDAIIKHWENRNQFERIETRLYPFGWGDGGGGPTRDHLEYLRRCDNLEGVPKTKMSHPVQFFKDLEEDPLKETYKGELYFQAHRGTYTSQAKTKKGNRKSEFALREAEFWNSIVSSIKDFNYPAEQLENNWKKVLLNQFHDILPGSSIERVYKEAEDDYKDILDQTKSLISTSVEKLIDSSQKEKAITVFNSLSWERKELIEVPDDFKGVKSVDGQLSPVQKINGSKKAEIKLPSCGWLTVKPTNNIEVENTLKVEKHLLENRYLRIIFDKKGEIKSIYDKTNDYEFAEKICNSFRMYQDIPGNYDAWDIDSMYKDNPVELSEKAEIAIMKKGPLVVGLKVTRKLNNSEMIQKIILRRDSRRLDFKTSIDWKEAHKLLKVNFPVNIHTTEVISEIQFGFVKRPNHNSRPYDKDQYEICNQKWSALTESNRGFALLNDSKYGLDADENSLNLTLLKSSVAPDMNADRGLQDFTYSLYVWEGSFFDSEVIKEAYNLNTPVTMARGVSGKNSVFQIDAKNIILETVKKAEDGSDEIIVRLYEAKKTGMDCVLKTNMKFKEVVETDMLEKETKKVKSEENRIYLRFSPFEIKTLRFKTEN